MLYCEACQRLIAPQADSGCPGCGEGLREAKANDPVLLLSIPSAQAMLVEPILKGAGIPYSKIGDLGVGFTMRAGSLLETYRFYIPYGAYAKGYDLLAATFGEDPIVMEGLAMATRQDEEP